MQRSYNQRSSRPSGGAGPTGGGGGGPSLADLFRQAKEQPVAYFKPGTETGERPVLRRELVDDEARQVAERLATLSATQLRRFYGAVMEINRQLQLKQMSEDEIPARMALLQAKAAYAKSRDAKRVPDELVRFFVRHTNAVRDRAAFGAFVQHFEAVVAYHYAHEEYKKMTNKGNQA